MLRIVSMDKILYFTNALLIIIIKWWDLKRLAGCLSVTVCLWKKSCVPLFTVIFLLSAAVHGIEGGHYCEGVPLFTVIFLLSAAVHGIEGGHYCEGVPLFTVIFLLSAAVHRREGGRYCEGGQGRFAAAGADCHDPGGGCQTQHQRR